MAKQVRIFWGIKVANFCQEVLNFLGSYTRVFTVSRLFCQSSQKLKTKANSDIGTFRIGTFTPISDWFTSISVYFLTGESEYCGFGYNDTQ